MNLSLHEKEIISLKTLTWQNRTYHIKVENHAP